uniref:Uncharacterized protein n=1 Tax=Cajanus cajan TaxID=3821 RepID=A0A151TPW5_CAJCA|nr:hypothetical protein KK1_008286 [Cajanus cajan]
MSDKRKQGHNDAVPGTQKKAREEASTAVTDEEVEEFYAILRRMNTAVKYFKTYGDDVAALEKDILREVKEATRNNNENENQNQKEDMEHNFTFDLNLTPQTPTI